MKLIKTLVLALTMPLGIAATAQSTIDILGNTHTVDTIFHAKVGPGTTTTSLVVKGTSGPLRVHYLTIDYTNPLVSIRTAVAGNKLPGTARTSAMAQSKSKAGLDYYCGVNGDFFTTSGTATNGTTKVGTPTTSATVDGTVYKTSNSNYQFTVDTDRKLYVDRLNYYTGTATLGEKVTLFKGINVGSPANGITIYTPLYYGTTNQTDKDCYEVQAKLVDGDKMIAGGKFRLEVTSEPNTTGDTQIPANGFVIHGRGTSKTGCNTGAKTFVGALKPGDIVEFDHVVLTSDGTRIYPQNIVSGNPKNVGDGATLDTEGERTDAKDRHPRTAIGYTQNQEKVIMMVVEGRVANSVGVRTSALADIMRYAGAVEAVNLDGGGSSTLYTRGIGIRNYCTDGSERGVGNAVFAVLEAPEDSQVAEISFQDWRKDMPSHATYTPVVYAFNKYGKMISNDYKDYTLQCDPALGQITPDGKSLYATGNGTHALTATAGDATVSIPVTVVAAQIEPIYSTVLLDNYRDWTVQLQAVADGEYMPIDAGVLDWTTSDASIATVDSDGTVHGIADGTATITGTDATNNIQITVNVETVDNKHINLFPVANPDDWTVSKTSIKTLTTTAGQGSELTIGYTLSSTRGPKITLTNRLVTRSLPDEFIVRYTPSANAVINSVVANIKANNETKYTSVSSTDVKAGELNEFHITPADIADPNDIGIYPLEFYSVAFNLGGVLNTDYSIQLHSIEAYYKNASGVDDITTPAADYIAPAIPGVALHGTDITLPAEATAIHIYDITGRLVRTVKAATTIDAPDAPGLYILRADIQGTPLTAKIAVK